MRGFLVHETNATAPILQLHVTREQCFQPHEGPQKKRCNGDDWIHGLRDSQDACSTPMMTWTLFIDVVVVAPNFKEMSNRNDFADYDSGVLRERGKSDSLIPVNRARSGPCGSPRTPIKNTITRGVRVRLSFCLPMLAACALLSQTHAVEAQTQSTEEEDLALLYGDKSTVSIATGTRQPLRRAPAVATVITAQDIAAMGATDLDDVLESVPGMHVSRSNNAYAPLYFIRGIQSEFNPQTLMLQNGVPVTTLFVGNRGLGWGGLPVENIARIEIIRGPGSALYGADAYSGVINIITKTAADIAGTEVGVRAGSFKSRNGWVQYGGKVGIADIAAYLGAGSTDGFKETVAADQQSLLDGMFVTHASLAPGPVNVGYDSVDGGLDISQGKLRFRAGYKLRDNLGTGAGVAAALDPVGKFRTERFLGDLSWNDIEVANNWRMNLQASYL